MPRNVIGELSVQTRKAFGRWNGLFLRCENGAVRRPTGQVARPIHQVQPARQWVDRLAKSPDLWSMGQAVGQHLISGG